MGGDDLGVIVHPAPNLEPGDEITLSDGAVLVVTAKGETPPDSPIAGLLMLAPCRRVAVRA